MSGLNWNKDTLFSLVSERLGEHLFIVVSNREPYVHEQSGGEIVCQRPVSGLTEALDPVMRASGGVWVAQGTGSADKYVVDQHDRVAVPPDEPEYTLRRVWLTNEQVAGFYLGFANEGLWPLCQPVLRRDVIFRAILAGKGELRKQEVRGRSARDGRLRGQPCDACQDSGFQE